MTREEVIRGLECRHRNPVGEDCENCHYGVRFARRWGCDFGRLCGDALTLLREQEPVAPVLQSGGNYVCGNCGMYTVGYMHPLTGESVQTWKYCGSCGKKVRWDG